MPYYVHTSHKGCDSHGENSWPFERLGRAKGIQRSNSSEWEKKKKLPIYRVEQFESFQMKHPRYPLECFWTACKYYMGKTWNSHEFQTGMHSWIMENQSRNTHIKI